MVCFATFTSSMLMARSARLRKCWLLLELVIDSHALLGWPYEPKA